MITTPSAPPNDALDFENDACSVIEDSHRKAWNYIKNRGIKRPQWEPLFVAYLCAAMRDLANSWKPRISSIDPTLQLSVSAVFTHQSPYVEWSSGGNLDKCELADLVIAFVDKTSLPGSGFAMLVQAKQGDGSPLLLGSKSEKKQFHLLHHRPRFDVKAKSAPTGVSLPTTRNGHDLGLFYGMNPPKNAATNPPPWGNHRWNAGGDLSTAPVLNQVSVPTCLAKTLVRQLQGAEGWSFDLPPAHTPSWSYFTGKDDWAALINYLLEETFSKPLRSLRSMMRQPNRGNDHAMFLQSYSPARNAMFFYSDAPDEARNGEPLYWIADSPEHTQWMATDHSLNELGGGNSGGGSGNEGTDEFEPESGPISAVVFEIGKRRNDGNRAERE